MKPTGSNPTFAYTYNVTDGSLTMGSTNKPLEPENIFINNRTVVVEWNDDTKTKSTASSYDTFDPEIGFAMCLMKKMFGKKIHGKKLYRRMIKKAKLKDLDADAQNAMDSWLTNRYAQDQFPF